MIIEPNTIPDPYSNPDKPNERHMEELRELGARINMEYQEKEPEQPSDEMRRERIVERDHRDATRSREKEIHVTSYKEDLHLFKKMRHEESPEYNRFLKTREQNWDSNSRSHRYSLEAPNFVDSLHRNPSNEKDRGRVSSREHQSF